MNIASRFDSPQSREMPHGSYLQPRSTWKVSNKIYGAIQLIPNYTCLRATVRQRLISLNVEKEVITNRTPWDLTQFTRRSLKKTQRPRAGVRRRGPRGRGLEKQLDHLRAAAYRRPVQRGQASVRSPSCGRSSGNPDVPTPKMIEPVHPGKVGY